MEKNIELTQKKAGRPRYWWKAIASFFMVLLTMPLGHALMIMMEHIFNETALHYAAFSLGFIGMILVIIGVFVKGDTKQTLFGFFGALLFWTGWVEFLFQYYAIRFGTQPELDPLTGEVITRPEYLILPATFGLWMMIMLMYLFSTKNGCNFLNWCQRHLFGSKKEEIAARPMTRHTSIVTFMEFMMIIWAMYILLMFCYDDNFLGENHPVTLLVGVGCFIGSLFMFERQTRLPSWGANIRMAIATVMVFWTPVEILGRMNMFSEIWVDPTHHVLEMVIILGAFIAVLGYLIWAAAKKKSEHKK